MPHQIRARKLPSMLVDEAKIRYLAPRLKERAGGQCGRRRRPMPSQQGRAETRGSDDTQENDR
jgi:hypothetical protein